tara:strand:+ start:501 stop:731 length:231 start_codon:yes stop_codon:yes gene_type:complete
MKKPPSKKPPTAKQGKKPPTAKQGKKPKELTPAQLKRLEKHSVHHSKKHMNMMKKDMMNGMSFKMAHEKAQKSVGK